MMIKELFSSSKKGRQTLRITSNNGSIRTITTYSYDEKKEQENIKTILASAYNSLISSHAYAYVKGKSCLLAISEVQKCLSEYSFFLKLDIRHFFASINHRILTQNLLLHLERETVKQIMDFVAAGRIGITEGSNLSPFLSNIYLINFDNTIGSLDGIKYFRYSDDILLLTNDFPDHLVDVIIRKLAEIRLYINDSKTAFGRITEGVPFLGFILDRNGRRVRMESKSQIFEKLKDISEDPQMTLEGRIEKLRQVIAGWSNYYKEKPPLPNNNVCLCYLSRFGKKDEILKFCDSLLAENIPLPDESFTFIYNTVKERFGRIYSIDFYKRTKRINDDSMLDELVSKGMFGAAKEFSEYIESSHEDTLSGEHPIESFKELFSIRNDKVYLSEIDGRKNYIKKSEGLSTELIKGHLAGDFSLAICCARNDDKSNLVVFDIDMKNTLLHDETLRYATKSSIDQITKLLSEAEVNAYVEFSGLKGFHIWVFFDDYYKVNDINYFAQKVIGRINDLPIGMTIEIYPRPFLISSGDENIIKLPLGFHPVNAEACPFIINGVEIDVPDDIMPLIKRSTLPSENKPEKFTDLEEIRSVCEKSYQIYKNCSIVRHLIDKAVELNFIGHYERLVLSYIFPQLGNGGRQFIHYFLSKFNNYNKSKTDKYIDKSPTYAISCPKLRRYFYDEIKDLDCSCDFQLIAGEYPSPILHASCHTTSKSKDAENGKSYETSKNVSSDESWIEDNINEIVAIKKEITKHRKRLSVLENKLDKYFEDNNITSCELSIGKLIYNKNSDKKWMISI